MQLPRSSASGPDSCWHSFDLSQTSEAAFQSQRRVAHRRPITVLCGHARSSRSGAAASATKTRSFVNDQHDRRKTRFVNDQHVERISGILGQSAVFALRQQSRLLRMLWPVPVLGCEPQPLGIASDASEPLPGEASVCERRERKAAPASVDAIQM